MKATILHISEGSNIICCIMDFAINNQVGVTIMSAFGLVRDVMLSQPKLSLPGAFLMLSLTGSVNASGSSIGDFAIALAGDQGRLFEGTVAGKLVAASDVLVAVATTFDSQRVYLVWPDGAIEEEGEFEEEEEEEEGLTDMEWTLLLEMSHI